MKEYSLVLVSELVDQARLLIRFMPVTGNSRSVGRQCQAGMRVAHAAGGSGDRAGIFRGWCPAIRRGR